MLIQEPEMLLGVAAAVYAFERREIIRQTWGTYAETENVKVTKLKTKQMKILITSLQSKTGQLTINSVAFLCWR